MIEKIRIHEDDERLKTDLERYKTRALTLGASRAAIVKVTEIPVEDRVMLKCRVPRCVGYGSTANCPPNALKPAELREYLKAYSWAVLFAKDVPPENIVSESDFNKLTAAYRDIFNIATDIESASFFDGHYLAFGLAAGSCRAFCGNQECMVLAGKPCRFPKQARPSMESVGIDVFKMVARAGWDIYPIGSCTKASDVPKGTLAGIVIVE